MRWVGWAMLIIGAWVLVSPWLAPFLGISTLWNEVFSGAIVAIAALWWLFGDKPNIESKT